MVTAASGDFFGGLWPRPTTPLDVAISFLNTWDLLAHPPELLLDAASLRRYLDWIGGSVPPVLTDQDVRRAIVARDRVREAFEVKSEDEAVCHLNQLIRDVGAVPQLARSVTSWQIWYVPRRVSPTNDIVAQAAGGLLGAIRDGLWARLGTCAADPCRCAYIDRTKNRVRRFCSVPCTDRMMQAAYRRRRSAVRPSVN